MWKCAYRLTIFVICIIIAITGCVSSPSVDNAASVGGPHINECIYVKNSRKMLRLTLPVVSYSSGKTALLDSSKRFASQNCRAGHVKPFISEGEYPVLVRTNITLMSVEGDICAPSPKFIIYEASLESIYGHGYSRQLNKSVDPMVYRISSALAVMKKRCDTQPDVIQFVARRSYKKPRNLISEMKYWDRLGVDFRKLQPGITPNEYFYEFFSGKIFPNKSLNLVSDDTDQEKAYWSKRRKMRNENQRRALAKKRRQAIGAAFGMMIFVNTILENQENE